MIRPPFRSPISCILVAAAGFWLPSLSGCGKQQNNKDTQPDVKIKESADDTLATALKFLKQATEITHFHDALNLVNDYLGKVSVSEENRESLIRELTEERKAFIQSHLAANGGQLKFLAEPSFQPLDAYHLEASFLFRGAARSLELAGLNQQQQCSQVLDWVVRHVLLHEQGDEDIPPQFVLKRGYGSVRDRALIFLNMLRQFDIGGCLVTIQSEKGPEGLLVGVLSDEEKLSLYDPRLGRAVRGPKDELVTLRAALKNPELLRPHGIETIAKDGVVLRLGCPLTSLSPRMAFLESRLLSHVRITLYQDPVKLRDDLHTATDLQVAPWVLAEGKPIPPPLLLNRFLPTKEGGGEDASRMLFFHSREFPQGEIRYRLATMGLAAPEIPQEAVDQMMAFARDLYAKFLMQPRDMLLQGRPDDAIRRLNRILDTLDEFDQRGEAKDDAGLAKQLTEWRDRINEAYTAGLKTKGAELRVWTEDKYLPALLDVEKESVPRMAAFMKDKVSPITLTLVLLRAGRRSLGEDTHFLLSQALQDAAERREGLNLAARLAKKETKSGKTEARQAWSATRDQWEKFAERYTQSQEDLKKLREDLERRWQAGQQRECLVLLERVLLDLHKNYHARYQHVEALSRLGQTKAASAQAKRLQADVTSLLEDKEWRGLVERFQKEAADPHLGRAFSLLARDWQPYAGLATWRDLIQRGNFEE